MFIVQFFKINKFIGISKNDKYIILIAANVIEIIWIYMFSIY